MRLKIRYELKGRHINLLFNDEVVSARVLVGFFERIRGLIGASWSAPTVLLLNCRDIHTHLMTIPIDVAFVSREGEVISVCLALYRGSRIRCKGAVAVLERPASQHEWVSPGDQIVAQTL